MAIDVTLAEAARLPIHGWRIEEGGLVLRFTADDERGLRCLCGRDHWIVETRREGGQAILAVKCHGCGRTGAFHLIAEPVTPGP